MMMMRQAGRIAARHGVAATCPVAAPAGVTARLSVVRTFGALTKPEDAVARPFKGASRSEPEMEYIEEPSMLYMTCLYATPIVFSFWFLTKFV
mmetsp:Transcript_36928/g.94194  ORF Transcript_36928/g.94194 Transcript_36928/m.94194 type:complete len:93 (-) Transcript_36928:129-407(-)